MISVDVARRLRLAGVRWRPRSGDQFAIRSAELDGEVFTVADMVVEAREYPTGTILAFNGTTEWALDSIQLEQALWLPREDQLRELLGPAFLSLARHVTGYEVRTSRPDGTELSFRSGDAAQAYAEAVLAHLAAG
ncbi:MAG: pilus assembly protein CpaE [Propionicimonas sp.]|uniref:pilus assembly protein CpaE n=1 Tax=Propionicimonas sp. TaxID=1955623 RepID=UPI003D0BAF8E